jgi:hypothetical protein
LENQKDRYHVGDTGINGRATLWVNWTAWK